MAVNLDSITGVPYLDTILNLGSNQTMIIIILVVILAFFLFFSSLGGSESTGDGMMGSSSDSGSKSALEILLWGVFIVLVLLNGMAYFYNINIKASIRNLFGKEPEVDVLVDPDTAAGDPNKIPNKKHNTGDGNGDGTRDDNEDEDIDDIDDNNGRRGGSGKGEVFHIPGNKYSYNDAEAVCSAYGARLANYKEVEGAYNNGADWCSYGWSADQMALYPTQYDKWQKLQKIKGHKHDCGRPGINGGFIDNKNVKFGVNCFGVKPEITEYEAKLMNESSLYPKTRKEIQFDKKIARYKDSIPNILVAPFNHEHWREV